MHVHKEAAFWYLVKNSSQCHGTSNVTAASSQIEFNVDMIVLSVDVSKDICS
uniref:Uncharacterized protein n=1 Tax=Arion vulgaris TaxID=1028688 RepID=A0A0B7AQA4_9EUPU